MHWDGSVISFHGSLEKLEDGLYSFSSCDERCRVEKFKNSIPLIVDELKPIFGLPKIGRHRLDYLDFTSVLLSRELGLEKPVVSVDDKDKLSEPETYDVFKTRIFRWIVGLPTTFVSKDMIIRKYKGIVEVISNKDESIDFSRPDPPFVKSIAVTEDLWNVETAVSAMLYGYSLATLKDALIDVILKIDPSMVWVSNGIVNRLSSYGFLKEDLD